jgi:hypothetical protein
MGDLEPLGAELHGESMIAFEPFGSGDERPR